MFKRGMSFILAFAICICSDICGMGFDSAVFPYSNMNNIRKSTRLFDIKQSLDIWPVISPLVTDAEKYYYDLIWDENKSLEENKKNLMNDLFENCFDFSFKLQRTELDGIYLGKVDSGEDMVFVEGKVGINVRPSSDEVLVYNEKDGERGLATSILTNVFPNVIPMSAKNWMKKEFEKYIKMIEEDPVGCEILRVIIAKYKGNQNLIPKLTIIPVANENIGLSYTTGSNLWKYVKNEKGVCFDKYSKLTKGWKFLLFSPDWFDLDQKGLLLNRCENGNYNAEIDIVPREIGLLHQIIYAMHVGMNNEDRENRMISERSGTELFLEDVGDIGSCVMSGKQINSSIFVDDKIYRTMFGFTPVGIDLINEARYVAHKYGYLRLSYIGNETKLNIDGKEVNEIDTIKFLKNFLQENGDKDLYNYYLSPDSYVKCPRFGVGAYKYLKGK